MYESRLKRMGETERKAIFDMLRAIGVKESKIKVLEEEK